MDKALISHGKIHQDVQMATLESFFHQITGPEQGRKWVFLHGLMGFSANWRKIISSIEATERCLVFDQRGHGRSLKPDSGYAPENFAQDLLEILNELGWEKIILVGHSMGGRNAMSFAAQHPERVEKLVLEDIGPEASPEGYKYYVDLLNLAPTPFPNRDQARTFFKEVFPNVAKTRENPKMLGEYFYANMIETQNGQVDWRFSKNAIIEAAREGRAVDRWQDLLAIKAPTLLIKGQNSADLSLEVYNEMLAKNKNLSGIIIPNAGHWVHSDQSQAFIEQIKNFAGGF